MSKPRNKKARYSAWFDVQMAHALDQWLDAHPGKNRTDFLVEAVGEKLKREKVVLPPEVYAEKPKKKAGKSTRRGTKVILGAWMDERLLAGVDVWMEHHPHGSRTHFLIASVAEKLQGEGVQISNISALRTPGRRFEPHVYYEIKIDEKANKTENTTQKAAKEKNRRRLIEELREALSLEQYMRTAESAELRSLVRSKTETQPEGAQAQKLKKSKGQFSQLSQDVEELLKALEWELRK